MVRLLTVRLDSFSAVTAIILAQAALTILENYDDLQLGGGIYTPACLGQPFIERLNSQGFKFETKIIES